MSDPAKPIIQEIDDEWLDSLIEQAEADETRIQDHLSRLHGERERRGNESGDDR